MWELLTNYGDNPKPRRYYLREPAVAPDVEKPPKSIARNARTATTAEPAKRNDWHRFLLILMRALAPFPDAKDAVVAAFRGASP